MRTIGHSRIQRGRALLGGAIIASLLTFGSGAVAASASTQVSATPSAFCHTMLTFHPKEPTGTSYSSYKVWARASLPFWSRLASEAPRGSVKTVLVQLVTIIKYEANARNVSAISAYMRLHEKQWVAGWKDFLKAVMSCTASLY